MKKLTISILFTAVMVMPLFAQDASGVRAKATEAAQKYASSSEVVLADSTSVVVAPNGSGTFTIYKAVVVNNITGALNNRVIKYDYDPLTAFAEFSYVNVYKTNGDVISLDVAQTNDYAAPARSIYWGARQIMLEVGKLSAGDIIEYQINKKGFTYALLAGDGDEDRFIPPMRGQFYDIVPFWSTYPTLRKVYRVSLPMEKEMQFQFYQGECSSSMRYEDERKVYSFVKDNITPFAKESNMVDLFDVAPKLMMSSTPRWQDKSEWFYNVNEDYDSFAAYEPAQKVVDKLIKGKVDEMEKIAVLTHWVADNIRYSGISMGEGEGFTLHNTQMNFTDRAGVCKDIAATLISFLRMAGFEAFPAMTMAGSRVESIPADHFNHCVAVVKLSNGTLMPLDPTWVPFCRELWSSAEQQQNYLPGTPEGTDLCLTPTSDPENHYVHINVNNKIDANGTLVGEFTIDAEGQSDSNIRRIFTTGWRSEWLNSMESQLLAVSPSARLISVDWGKNPKDYQKAPIKITFRYEIPNYAIVGDDELIFKAMTMSNLYTQVLSHLRIDISSDSRNYGFKDACSREVVLNETIQLPNNYKLVNESLDENFSSSAADFTGKMSQEGSKISISQKLSLYKRVYEASDWTGYRNAVKLHKKFGEYLVVK